MLKTNNIPSLHANQSLNNNMEPQKDNDHKEEINGDVTLLVADQTLTCSRTILMENSAYFRTLFCPDHEGFKESKQSEITLKAVDPDALNTILKCLTEEQSDGDVAAPPGKLLFQDFSSTVLETSAMLQFESIFEQCVKFASDTLDIENCLKYMATAEQLGAKKLQTKARFFALWKFSEVSTTLGFLELNLEDLRQYLSSDYLRISNEMKVIESIMEWIESDPDERRSSLLLLVNCVRWKQITFSDLKSLTLYPIIAGDLLVSTIVKCIISLLRPNDDPVMTLAIHQDAGMFSHLTATSLMELPIRQMPQVPCFIGRRVITSTEPNLSNEGAVEKVLCVGYVDLEQMQLKSLVDITKIEYGPLECTGYSVVSLGKDVFLIGGEHMLGHGRWNLTLWSYDVLSQTWSAVGSLPSPRRHASVCVCGDRIFLLGGVGKHRIVGDFCDAFSVSSRTWEKFSPMPEKLYSAACCSHKDRVYIVGSQVYCFIPHLNLWYTLNSIKLPGNLGFHSALSYQNHIYLTGKYTNELFRFNPEEAERHPNVKVETLGCFQNKAHKSCIIQHEIYVFSDMGEKGLFIEKFNIDQRVFSILWFQSETNQTSHFNQAAFVDFIPDQNGGCFPLIQSWLC